MTEALEFLKQKINKTKYKELNVITGAGNHSEGNHSKVKEIILGYLKENKL